MRSKDIKLLIGILGIPALGVIGAFALFNPEIVNHWVIYILIVILGANIIANVIS